ncbi:MAG: hypothetical protein COV74_08135 [Candidatus Omnitrophica bacterium CG11_big_fil_rev_8_21_14_0_20_45_26]|uniref:Uncharacterized protein n=1 Tax=Candidatus Abzuiibacterium crystallinum TaxID=1974748 RepID=A0A2H0LMN2_9BACT|nr:MAG: hypothetical protein COV74_08135 [Candidatus Omnitrophica bacterium CG11_big_fil_rev_8_21_14_0_20_45_26]PIW65188.1 MAG: hypothetical protein COW12_03175 [Candidatus Omnitrophica bacterium CG12_big_fil_rev_8_21_14_0_65_45_16]
MKGKTAIEKSNSYPLFFLAEMIAAKFPDVLFLLIFGHDFTAFWRRSWKDQAFLCRQVKMFID